MKEPAFTEKHRMWFQINYSKLHFLIQAADHVYLLLGMIDHSCIIIYIWCIHRCTHCCFGTVLGSQRNWNADDRSLGDVNVSLGAKPHPNVKVNGLSAWGTHEYNYMISRFEYVEGRPDHKGGRNTTLSWKRASRHNGVLLRHFNFHTWSEHGVLCTLWRGAVLRATTVYNVHLSSDHIAPQPPL